MREIKFRCWDGFKMHIVESFDCARNPAYWFKPLESFNAEMQPHSGEVRNRKSHPDFILMQFTGLLDKNGKEIYEGDRCKCKMYGIETHIEELETEVFYDLTVGAFGHRVTSNDSDYTLFGLNSKNLLSCEIIGNLYQNPELTTQPKDQRTNK